MNRYASRRPVPRVQDLAARALRTLERFLHIEAVSGIVLLAAAAMALAWANSPFAPGYHALWHAPLTFGVGDYIVSQTLHFWINDALMAVFFLVVGMEIRREIHEGALAGPAQAALPLAAALGGVAVPALIYLAINGQAPQRHGWAVPTATDIAFAVGVLALLGRSVPAGVRIFLLALAIIDDIVAVLIIAAFYSGGLDHAGLLAAAVGILMVLGLQRVGAGSAWAYVLPGAVLWTGLLQAGAHPTLAGVVLGLMTPVVPARSHAHPLDTVRRAADFLVRAGTSDTGGTAEQARRLRWAQRELIAPVTRVQTALHPWVAYVVLPLFALANAGVTLEGVDLDASSSQAVMLGVAVALVAGKPLGVLAASWLAVRLGGCRLPPGTTWGGIALAGLLAGIGFTMSIFIATLAFGDENLLGAAKLGVLMASSLAAAAGLGWGAVLAARRRRAASSQDAAAP